MQLLEFNSRTFFQQEIKNDRLEIVRQINRTELKVNDVQWLIIWIGIPFLLLIVTFMLIVPGIIYIIDGQIFGLFLLLLSLPFVKGTYKTLSGAIRLWKTTHKLSIGFDGLSIQKYRSNKIYFNRRINWNSINSFSNYTKKLKKDLLNINDRLIGYLIIQLIDGNQINVFEDFEPNDKDYKIIADYLSIFKQKIKTEANNGEHP
jgi:hypothetical protein